jgi:hypothetical protein
LQRASHRCPASTRSPAFATLAQYFASSSTVPSSCFFCLSCAKTPPTEPPWPRRFRRGVRRFSGVSSDIRRSALWWARCGMVLRIDQFCRRQCPALSWGLHPCAVLAAPRSGCVCGEDRAQRWGFSALAARGWRVPSVRQRLVLTRCGVLYCIPGVLPGFGGLCGAVDSSRRVGA